MSFFYNKYHFFSLQKRATLIRKNPILEKAISSAGNEKYFADTHESNTSRKTIRFKCQFCDKSFPLNHILNIHISKKHAKNVDRKLCLKLQKFQGVWHSRFITKNLNVDDMNNGTGYECQMCHQHFPAKSHLIDHVVCCKKSNTAKSNMSVISRSNDPTNASLMCKQEFMEERFGSENASEANDAKKATKRFYCSTCKDMFPSMDILIAHQSLHTIARPFICRFCHRTFSNKTYRTIHEKVHGTNINTFDSKDSRSQQKNENQSYNRMHHQDRYCSICKKQFVYLGAFNSHVAKIHFQKTTFDNNVEENPVDIVENITNIKLEYPNDSLQAQCVCCETIFDEIAQLKLHLSFNSRCNNYYTHIRPDILMDSLVIQCIICDKTFCKFNNRKRHLIQVHKILEEDCL